MPPGSPGWQAGTILLRMGRQPKRTRTQPQQPQLRSETSRRRLLRLIALIAAVAAVTAVAHWPALSARAYSFDDAQYMLKNPLVLSPSWASAKRFLSEVLRPSTVEGYYQPLAMISLMLDAGAGGGPEALRPFHRTSLALHVANTGLLVLFLYLLFGQPWPAALTGLLFGVHPLTVEPIPWIGERKTLLGAFFALACLILYVLYTRRGTGILPVNARATSPGHASGRRLLYAAALIAFLLALMSKPTTTPIPVLLLLLDYWPLRRLNRRVIVEKIPYFLLGAVSAVVTVISQARTASVTLPGERPAGWIPLTLAHNIIFYLYKLIWPANLSSHYPFPEPMSPAHPIVLAGVIGTALLLVALHLSWRRTRAFVTGWLFFFLAIFPTLGVIGFTDVIASDKFAYLPSVGLLMVLAWALSLVWTRPARANRIVALAAVALLAGAEFVGTRRYLAVWQDTDGFWSHMLERAPKASMLRSNYAGFLIEDGRVDEALGYAEEALKLNPENYAAHNILGTMLVRRGRIEQGLAHLEKALTLRPADYVIHGNIAAALDRLGRREESFARYAEAVALRPTSPEIHYNFAGALAASGRLEEAVQHYARAAELNPLWAEPHERMGVVLASHGRIQEAAGHLQDAVRLRPEWTAAHLKLGAALAQLGRIDQAIEHYRIALRLDPELGEVRYNLANALVLRGRAAEAVGHYREALRLNPSDAQAQFNLAQALRSLGQTEAAEEAYAAALRLKPDWAEAHNDLGVLLAQGGRLEDAAAHFREAVRLRPDWAEARRNLDLATGGDNAD